jgi:translocation protein SEC62
MSGLGGVPPLQPGQQPTPAQIAAMQQQLAKDAAANGMTVPQFIQFIKQKQMEAMQAAQQQQQQEGGGGGGQPPQGQPQPIQPGPPNPAAIAVAKFLRSQDLKPRTCILNGQRKDMFKGWLTIASRQCTGDC